MTETLTGTMTGTEAVIDCYLAAYGEPDAALRRSRIAEAFTADATVADPPIDGRGHQGIDAMFAAVQSQFPNHTFRRSSSIDEHHGTARYEWDVVALDGTISVTGTDFVRFSDTGLISSVVGYFGPVPAMADRS